MSDFQPFAGDGRRPAGARKNPPKRWLHPPSNLVSGSIIYTVKFWGSTDVAQPKGADIVKGAIERVKFQVHIKKQQGHKPPKVELCISANALRTQDPKTKGILHQHALSTISYCGDDKSNKAVFAYITKSDSGEGHTCYIFETDKFADQITLTVGQAFDLAFKRFKQDSGTDIEMKKKLLSMEKSMQEAEAEKHALRKRIAELQMKKDMTDVEALKLKEQVNLMQTPQQSFDLSPAQSSAMDSRPPAPLPGQGGNVTDLFAFDAPPAAPAAQPQSQQLDWDPFSSTSAPSQQPAADLFSQPAAPAPAPTQQDSWAAFDAPSAQAPAASQSSWASFDSAPAPAAPAAAPVAAPAKQEPFNPFGSPQPAAPAAPAAQPAPQTSQWASFDEPALASPTSPQQTAGHFQPFSQQQQPPPPQPLFGNVDSENIDSAIANIEEQLANLQEGFDAGFSLGPMSPTSPTSPTGGNSLLQF